MNVNLYNENTNVSLFGGATEHEFIEVSFADIINTVGGDQLKDEILNLRSLSKVEYDKQKKQLVCFKIAGTGERGNDAGGIASGLFGVDLDKLDLFGLNITDVKNTITNHRSVVACYISPSGSGLKVFYNVGDFASVGGKINQENNVRCFEAIKIWFSETYPELYNLSINIEENGVTKNHTIFDTSCKNAERLCFLSWDPDVYYNENSEVLMLTAEMTRVNSIQKAKQRNKRIKIFGPIEREYNNRADIEDLLLSHGWTKESDHVDCRGNTSWIRPGKDAGVSATWNEEMRNFHVFSDAVSFGEGDFRPFELYTILEFDGDEDAALVSLMGDEVDITPADTTDLMTAFKFSEIYNDRMKVVETDKKLSWICFDKFWAKSCKGPYKLFAEYLNDLNTINNDVLTKWVRQCHASSRFNGIVGLSQKMDAFTINNSAFNPIGSDYLFNVNNGTVDVYNNTFLPHTKEHMITNISNFDYDPCAKCPTYDKFIKEVLVDDDIIFYTDRLFSYFLTGKVNEEVLLFAVGDGNNGKSTLIKVLLNLFGGYGMSSPRTLVEDNNRDVIPTDVADLWGKRFSNVSELGKNGKFNEDKLKRLVSTDDQTGRHLFEDHFNFRATHHLFLASNHKPEIEGNDNGIWRRIHLLPFNQNFLPRYEYDRLLVGGANVENIHLRDDEIEAKLKAEIPGIFNRFLTAYQQYKIVGLNPPQAVIAATAQYRQNQDVFGQFLDECTISGQNYSVQSSTLYNIYSQWAHNNSFAVLASNKFSEEITNRGFTKHKSHGVVVWCGVSINPSLNIKL